MVLEVDGRGLAVLRAQAAVDAFRAVNAHLQPREAGHKTEYRAHGTYCVAVCPAAAPGHHGYDDERHRGHDERRQTLHPHVYAVKGVAVEVLGHGRQHVVARLVDGLHQAAGYAAVRAVRRKQRHNGVNSGQGRSDEHRQHRVAQPALLL